MAPTKQRIIEATLALIGERGLNDVTMIDVARTAGLARQTLYNHYPDIDSIVADALTRHNRDSVQQLKAAVAVVDPPVAKMEQLVRYIAQISTHHGHTIAVDHSLAPHHRAALDEFGHALDALVAEIITEGQADRSFRADLDLKVDAALVRRLLIGVSELVAAAPEDAAKITATATCTVLAALGHHPSG
jgi:AcrR family transcriptional regulator